MTSSLRTRLTLGLVPIVLFVAAAVVSGWFQGERLQEHYAELRRQRPAARAGVGSPEKLPLLSAEVRREIAPPVPPAVSVQPAIAPFTPGEWTPSAAWRNEGRKTARATVNTFLWTAAGGDLRALRSMLQFDEASSRKAGELFARLPPTVRNYYGSGEDLVAGVTMKNIPLTEAQLMWLHQADADHAVAGLRLATAAADPETPPAGIPAAAVTAPPALPDRGEQKIVVLSLLRTETGWRVVVPAAAVDRVAQELTAPAAKPARG
ncbi:MAG TPA: hypothetical protein VHN79_02920 [Lacunisphaera sp.]|nr:hypothetical protein [Lacunisphaera sp.]